MNPINENNLTEQSLIDWLKGEEYEHVYGPDINPGQTRAEREDFRGVVLKDRLLGAIRRINPSLPAEQAEIIVKEISGYSHNDLVLGNKEVYSWITNGKKISWRENGDEKTDLVKLIDFTEPSSNEFLVVNQFTVQGIDNVCRLDAVIFVNGLPLGVFELKSPVRQAVDIREAHRDIEYYKKEIPKLFLYNQVVGLSDLLVMTTSNLWYLDDGFANEPGEILSYTVDPCLDNVWLLNTTVEVRIVATDENSDDVQVRVVLYEGTAFEQDSNWEFGSENITENQDYLFASNLEKSMVINIFYRKQGFFWYSGDILKDKYDEDLTYNEAKVLYYYLNERKKELRKRFVKEVTFSDNGNVLVLSKNAPPIVKQQVNVWVKKLVKDGHLEQIGD